MSAPASSILYARHTPKEAPWLRPGVELDVPADFPNRLNSLGAGYVARQQYVELCQVGLTKTFVEIQHLFSRCLRALDLLVRGMVTCQISMRCMCLINNLLTVVHRVDCRYITTE
jgi:hypothetical protein